MPLDTADPDQSSGGGPQRRDEGPTPVRARAGKCHRRSVQGLQGKCGRAVNRSTSVCIGLVGQPLLPAPPPPLLVFGVATESGPGRLSFSF
eukprot:scaffold4100_cov372-Prasinococcus_capsulatus_cf.AAC.3